MRLHVPGAMLLVLLGLAAAPASLAQGKRRSLDASHPVSRKEPDSRQKAIQPRLLTTSEGLAILGAALDSRHRPALSSDCSHFVHALYARAGFPYEYASSSDLYEGADEFWRVATPQPGDLAVWRGHAGIVINPAQHSFFSVLRSGPGVDSYDSAYWKQRGRPRFFRYVKTAPSRVLDASIRRVSLPAASSNPQPHWSPAANSVPDVAEERDETAPAPKLAQGQGLSAEVPRVVVVSSGRPKADQVGVAFQQACRNWEESLNGRDFLKPGQSLVVFERFEIKKVHIKGEQGWAEVQIEFLATLGGEKADMHKRSEWQRWPLIRREGGTWELTPARNTIYLPQTMAARVMARALAQMTAGGPDRASRTKDMAELARMLDVLLAK